MIYTDGVHLIADSLEELHAFAAAIGIKRIWFENRRGKQHPHYDIPMSMKQTVLSAGVKRVSSREIVELLRSMPECPVY